MTCKILTEDLWARFLEGSLNDREKAILREHMDTDCPDCEYLLRSINRDQAKYLRFLFNEKMARREAQNTSPDMIVPLDEDQFDAELDGQESDTNVVDLASIPLGKSQRRVDGKTPRKYRAPIWAGGIAALLLITVGVLPRFQSDDERTFSPLNDSARSQITKGDVNVLRPIQLQFVIGSLDDNGHYTFTRGVNGRKYSKSDSLFLHYDLPGDGYVYLLGYEAGKGVEIVAPAQAEFQSAGSYSLPPNSQAKGLSLEGIHGPYSVIALYAQQSLDNLDEVLAILKRSVDPGTGVVNDAALGSLGQAVTIDVVHFDVAE